nr:carboxypeptidase-like regulatory domain-containing protein [Chitinophagales bacterium]
MKPIFAAIFLLITQLAYSQIEGKLISVHYNNQSAEEVLKDLQQKENISFSYAPSLLPLSKKISLNADNKPVKQIIDELAKKLEVSYEVINNQIVFKAKPKEKTAPKQNIRGQVIDETTQQPLEGAIVKVLNTDPLLAAVTDSSGNFKIADVPLGRKSLSITFLGYNEKLLPDIVLDGAKELVISAPMKDAGIKIGEVTVSSNTRGEAQNMMATLSATSITVEETKRFVAAAFDPARVALNYAGVASNGDMNNELVVRGNSPKGVLYRMEGVEIINPNHFSALGSTGGPISMLSSSTLASCDFYTGAFPAEIGNASAGVMDLKLRSGNSEKREHSFMIGVLGIEAATEGYFTKKSAASYIVNYRYSTLGLMSKFIKSAQGTLPDYQDLSFKVNVPTKKAGTFSVWGIMGKSQSKHSVTQDTSKWETLFDRSEFKSVGLKGAYGISHKIILSKKSYLQSTVSYSGEARNEKQYNWYYDSVFSKIPAADISIKNHYVRVSELYNLKLTDRSTLRTGLIISSIGFDYKFRDTNTDSNITYTRYAGKGWSQQLQAYAQWQQLIGQRWTFDGGLHLNYLALNNTYSIEPRAAVRYKIATNQNIGLATGIHSKPEDLSTLLYNYKTEGGTTVEPNKNLLMPKAYHVVLGYDLT